MFDSLKKAKDYQVSFLEKNPGKSSGLQQRL